MQGVPTRLLVCFWGKKSCYIVLYYNRKHVKPFPDVLHATHNRLHALQAFTAVPFGVLLVAVA